MTTLKKINDELANAGLELIKWDNYFTFQILDIDLVPLPSFVKTAGHLGNGDQLLDSIAVCKLNHLSFEKWIGEAIIYLQRFLERYDWAHPKGDYHPEEFDSWMDNIDRSFELNNSK